MRELEFLPEDYLRARFQRRIGFIRSWLLLAIGLAMVLYSLQMGTWVREARAELEALQGTGSAVEADVEKVRRLREEARTYNERIARTEALRPRTTVTAVLADLVAAPAAGGCYGRRAVLGGSLRAVGAATASGSGHRRPDAASALGAAA